LNRTCELCSAQRAGHRIGCGFSFKPSITAMRAAIDLAAKRALPAMVCYRQVGRLNLVCARTVAANTNQSADPFYSRSLHSFFSTQFEATRDARSAAGRDCVTAGVQDFKLNLIGELVRVVIDLDGPREPVCLYPGSGGAENELLGHRAVGMTLCVSPHT
jgi:hypothetical protein